MRYVDAHKIGRFMFSQVNPFQRPAARPFECPLSILIVPVTGWTHVGMHGFTCSCVCVPVLLHAVVVACSYCVIFASCGAFHALILPIAFWMYVCGRVCLHGRLCMPRKHIMLHVCSSAGCPNRRAAGANGAWPGPTDRTATPTPTEPSPNTTNPQPKRRSCGRDVLVNRCLRSTTAIYENTSPTRTSFWVRVSRFG